MELSVNGIGAVVVTMKTTDAALGDLVMMDGHFQVKKATAEAEPIGICVSRNGDYAGIQVKGGVEVTCTDETLTPGYQMLKATSENGIAKGTAGALHLVVSVDTGAKTAFVVL